ncbi:MAG: CSLREA domain-containing protein [Anaerolineae bacterium]|nr:CSLREA domain-containing protein [Anaerolineae bacterium]
MIRRHWITWLIVTLLAFSFSLCFPGEVRASTFTVNTTNDLDDLSCDVLHCSLREAINAANLNPGPDTIGFKIPASLDPGCLGVSGVCMIRPLSELPALTEGDITIDGYTQDGSTLAVGLTPAALRIVLDGTSAPAATDGLRIDDSSGNLIKGLVIGGFESGIEISGSLAAGNVIEGCHIGTDYLGSSAFPNSQRGIEIHSGAHDNIIGGANDAARNVISGNGHRGVEISGPSSNGNRVVGNFIGTDSTGLSNLGNLSDGIILLSSQMKTEIGGSLPGERNVISGNGASGIRISGVNTLGTVISGNYIGVDRTGTSALANIGYGIFMLFGSQATIVGGDTPAEANIISGNHGGGIAVKFSGTAGNTIKGNYIGTGYDGFIPIPNGGDGIQVTDDAIQNAIGPANIIWYNAGNGVSVDAAYEVSITENSIYLNDVKGIHLEGAANNGLPAPTITQTSVGSLYVEGVGAPQDGKIELFSSPNSDGEGKTYLGSTTADVAGVWSLTVACSVDPFLTATVTDLAGNTSEFSSVITSSVRCLFMPLIVR